MSILKLMLHCLLRHIVQLVRSNATATEEKINKHQTEAKMTNSPHKRGQRLRLHAKLRVP